MKYIKIISRIVFLIVVYISCNTKQLTTNNKVKNEKFDLLTEYALCSCLDKSLKDSFPDFKDDSKSVYYDISDDELIIENKGKKIDSFIQVYLDTLKNNLISTRKYENRRTLIIDCISFSKSEQLIRFIQRLLN